MPDIPGDLERLHEAQMGSCCELSNSVIEQLTALSKIRNLGTQLEIIEIKRT